MKKEEKVVKTVEKKAKTIVKEETKQKNNKVIFNKDVKKSIRAISLILAFGAAVVALFTFIFGIITTLKAADFTREELLQDNFSITFISNMKNVEVSQVKDIVNGYTSKTPFIIFNIVLPAIAIISAMILLIFVIKKILDFISRVSTEKDLYTNDRLTDIEVVACLIESIIAIYFVVFNRPSFMLFLLVSLMFFIIIGLFKKCINE